MATDYNAINFKNKDIDRFSTRFGNGDPKKKGDYTTAPEPALPKFETESVNTKKDWRDRSKLGAILHGTPIPHKDSGGKKNMSPTRDHSDVDVDRGGQRKQDKECRKPK